MIEVYSPFGIWHVFYIVLTPISTTCGLWSTGNTRKYHQIDVYIYQCVPDTEGVLTNEGKPVKLLEKTEIEIHLSS